MVSKGITKDGLCIIKAYPCGFCRLRAKVNLSLRVQWDKWLHSRYAGMKRVTKRSSKNLAAGNLNKILERQQSWK